jgi:glycosyltransferase involved in cell wall biosynthesis
MKKKVKIIVVGQTPPPYGGQALMIEYMLDANFVDIELYHVRMCFSREMNERGRLSFYKITHLFEIIFKTIFIRFKYKADVLYYPPSNAPKISVFRDLIFLALTRIFFRKTIFHFHAAGISEFIKEQNVFLKKIACLILQKPDLGISSSSFNPKDALYLKAKKEVIIPLGIPNSVENNVFETKLKENNVLNILFVGLLNSTKGEGYLVDAIAILKNKGYVINLRIAGKFETEEYKKLFFEKVKALNLIENVEYLGVITGDVKKNAFLDAHLFCFPSFFVSESFGIVLLEAMMYKLPVIATKWRGIQSIINDGENGFLVDIQNSVQLAAKIEMFLKYPELINTMGDNSYNLFLENYTLSSYIENLEKEFIKI